MEIGLFQLENLIHSHSRFNFFDLRENTKALPESLEAILARAIRLSVKTVEQYVKDQRFAKDAPLILVCENGQTSVRAAEKLEAEGFTNVYVIEGGVEGLVSEL